MFYWQNLTSVHTTATPTRTISFDISMTYLNKYIVYKKKAIKFHSTCKYFIIL